VAYFSHRLNVIHQLHGVGFDLVGDENVFKPLIDYIEPLLHFRQRQKELGLDIPFIFHAGETLGDGTKADDNLYDALLLGTKRIGHG
jgi:adenosine deaminase CECR1